MILNISNIANNKNTLVLTSVKEMQIKVISRHRHANFFSSINHGADICSKNSNNWLLQILVYLGELFTLL